MPDFKAKPHPLRVPGSPITKDPCPLTCLFSAVTASRVSHFLLGHIPFQIRLPTEQLRTKKPEA